MGIGSAPNVTCPLNPGNANRGLYRRSRLHRATLGIE